MYVDVILPLKLSGFFTYFTNGYNATLAVRDVQMLRLRRYGV